jgi:phage-related protein
MSQQGGKVNKSLKDWVAFVKKVQKEEKLSYKDAISRAKARKDKGEKWMSGGTTSTPETTATEEVVEESVQVTPESEMITEVMEPMESSNIAGGKRTRRRHRARGRGRARSVKRSRSARRSRGRGRH